MFQRRPRKFRRRSNGRHHHSRMNDGKNRFRPNLFVSDKPRNFNTGQNAEKLFEKYNSLAKEALSSGDKTLSENYFQHADHFMRIIEDKNRNQNQRKPDPIQKPAVDGKNLSQKNDINLDHVAEDKK